MPCVNPVRRASVMRGSNRTARHGNWRQTYIDCAGMCIAQVNGDEHPCGMVDYLELHELWGENQDNGKGKFQQRVLLCNAHHSMIDDKCHQYTFIQGQHQPSMLAVDVDIEIAVCGSYDKWVEKHKLDNSRFGVYLGAGLVKVEEVVDENVVALASP